MLSRREPNKEGSKFNIKSWTSNAQSVQKLKSHASHIHKQVLSHLKSKSCLDECKSNRISLWSRSCEDYSINLDCFQAFNVSEKRIQFHTCAACNFYLMEFTNSYILNFYNLRWNKINCSETPPRLFSIQISLPKNAGWFIQREEESWKISSFPKLSS